MKKMKIFIVTYKRKEVLNDTLEKLFKSDFRKVQNTEVNIINNHTDFYLRPEFTDKVKVYHNTLRPDWSNGNVSENYNQAFINGIIHLNNPDTEILVTLQNDAVVHPNWCAHLNVLFDEKGYNFVTGLCGDTVTAYKVQAVKNIGMWDENLPAQFKETDYFLRALIHNKQYSCINDIVHGILLNHEPDYPIESFDDRNFVEINAKDAGCQIERRPDDDEQRQIWAQSRGGVWKKNAWNYFYEKWEGTWEHGNPVNYDGNRGWIRGWDQKMIDSPPDMTKSKIKNHMRYIYFEDAIPDKRQKNYFKHKRRIGRET